MNKTLSVLLCLATLLSLCACGNSESAENTELIKLSSEANTMFKKSEEAAFSLNKDFVSDDGLIEISIHDDTVDTIPATMDVLKVRPKVITSDMAETMAEGLFGNADFYEYSEEINKAEILNLIKACEYGVTDEAIFADYGSDIPNSQIDSIRNARLAILEYYRNACDNISASPCQWKFWPIEHYAFHDYSNTDNSYTDAIPTGLSVDLRAVTTAEGTPYELWVNNNEDADFRNHSFSAFALIPDGLLSGGVDYEEGKDRLREWYLQMGLCSPSPASQDELSTVSEHASNIASQMGLGEWCFSAKAIDIGNDAWQIELTGQPIYRGVPVSWQNPNEHQDFYLESLTIHTANSGKLVDLNYTSPLKVVEIVEQSAPLKTWDEIVPIAEQLMQKWSCKKLIPNYEPGKMWWDEVGAEIIKTKVDIDTVCVGYSRVPYDSTDYLLIPTVTFPGKLEIVGKIPGAEEAFDLLMADDTAYNVSLILDLRTGNPIE